MYVNYEWYFDRLVISWMISNKKVYVDFFQQQKLGLKLKKIVYFGCCFDRNILSEIWIFDLYFLVRL